jgi:hypothetical protein
MKVVAFVRGKALVRTAAEVLAYNLTFRSTYEALLEMLSFVAMVVTLIEAFRWSETGTLLAAVATFVLMLGSSWLGRYSLKRPLLTVGLLAVLVGALWLGLLVGPTFLAAEQAVTDAITTALVWVF